MEGQAGGGGVAFLVELGRGVPRRVPRAVDVGDAPRGGRAKVKTKAKATLTVTAGRTVARGRKETT